MCNLLHNIQFVEGGHYLIFGRLQCFLYISYKTTFFYISLKKYPDVN
jgi:hypothetical protein